MRMPDRLYRRLERAYLTQRRIRRLEADQRMAAYDRRTREWASRRSIDHDMGVCGGPAAGCPYVPCTPPVRMDV